MQIMIMYGAWMGSEYGLNAAQLGTIALIFGLFDLTASVSVSLFTDRIGKRRSVIIGAVGAFIGYLLMPLLSVSLITAVLITGLTRGLFEFSIVANFPLLSEQVPEQRGKGDVAQRGDWPDGRHAGQLHGADALYDVRSDRHDHRLRHRLCHRAR